MRILEVDNPGILAATNNHLGPTVDVRAPDHSYRSRFVGGRRRSLSTSPTHANVVVLSRLFNICIFNLELVSSHPYGKLYDYSDMLLFVDLLGGISYFDMKVLIKTGFYNQNLSNNIETLKAFRNSRKHIMLPQLKTARRKEAPFTGGSP